MGQGLPGGGREWAAYVLLIEDSLPCYSRDLTSTRTRHKTPRLSERMCPSCSPLLCRLIARLSAKLSSHEGLPPPAYSQPYLLPPSCGIY